MQVISVDMGTGKGVIMFLRTEIPGDYKTINAAITVVKNCKANKGFTVTQTDKQVNNYETKVTKLNWSDGSSMEIDLKYNFLTQSYQGDYEITYNQPDGIFGFRLYSKPDGLTPEAERNDGNVHLIEAGSGRPDPLVVTSSSVEKEIKRAVKC